MDIVGASHFAPNNDKIYRRLKEHPKVLDAIQERMEHKNQLREEENKKYYKMEFDRINNWMLRNRSFPDNYDQRRKKLQFLHNMSVPQHDIEKPLRYGL